MLFSSALDQYYIGHSNDPWRRVTEHNDSTFHKYTSRTADWELKAVFKVSESRGEALTIERWIKRQKNRKLIQQLCDPNFTLNNNLAQLVRVPHLRD